MKVEAPATYIIPPRSETIIPAKLKVDTHPGAIGLIESAPTLAERYQLQGAAALVRLPDSVSVPFRLINPSSKPVTLYKGATLGTFSEVDGNPDCYPVEAANHNQPAKDESETVPVDLQTSTLTPDEQTRLEQLLHEYRGIFAVTPDELCRTNLVQHHIETGNHPPLRSRPYRVPHAQKETIGKHIDDMLARNVIHCSDEVPN